ncbi:MAG: helix-turn-helix transcriptional regulator [Spirochaetes bacterium]|uniref:Helix-turn-helix transcriptional regulator n=1 Tax=Candidatus Gallitreponema excrementavium TaxID=2840840 RepID=A0A9D9HNF6_9SPIR|nr:helix-turn-helix transcriptional regulator [Candidatus Gallitreponema excrementavium]
MPNNISIGSLISSKRKEKNMTQNDLALKLNVTDKAVSKWERDICFPDVALLPEIAEILDLNLEDLILGRKKTSSNLFDLVLTAVSFAMGTAVFILSVLERLGFSNDSIQSIDLLGMCGLGIILISFKSLKKISKE